MTTTLFAERSWRACFSALMLDRFLAGELDGPETARVRGHVSGCATCAAALEELRTASAETLPPLRLVPLSPRSRIRVRAAAAVVGLAAAASVLLLARPGTRVKGPGFSLGMFVSHSGQVRRSAPGETVAPGDAVRFAVTTPTDVHVAVLSLDAKNHGSIYFPAGDRAELVRAGSDVPLPLGTRLDETTGEEHIVGLFCSSPVQLEPLRAGLERGDLQVPEGCQVTRWSFVKR